MREKKFDLGAAVREQILHLIQELEKEHKQKLPSEKDLANQFQVSRSTIRSVLAGLVVEGKIFRRHGSGTYINSYAFNRKATLYPQVYYDELIRESGYQSSIQMIGVERIRAEEEGIDKRLLLTREDFVLKVSKIYEADEQMCIYCIDYFEERLLAPEYRERLGKENISIFQFLFEYTDFEVSWDMIDLEAVDSRSFPELQKHIDGNADCIKPFLLIHTVNYNSKNEPMLYSKSYIDTNLIQYHLVRHNFDDIQ